MLTAEWVVAAVVVAVLLTAWIMATLSRLDRLHARVDAANAALDAQLVRRAAALLYLAENAAPFVPATTSARMAETAQEALIATEPNRERVENRVGKALTELAPWRAELPVDPVIELGEAATRVVIARRFYNDAVRDTRTLRARRMPRLLRLAGRRDLPSYFDIDDTMLFDEPGVFDEPRSPVVSPDSRPVAQDEPKLS